ncbi:MAG: hypothetical protein ACREL3_09695 [Gemmatimonadales bacterium]
MQCTKCGGEMNHHAEKLMVTAETREPGYDAALGGFVEENHACPGCGHLDTQRAR